MWHTFRCTTKTAQNSTQIEICVENIKNVKNWPFLALKLVNSLCKKISRHNAQTKKFLESHAWVTYKISGKLLGYFLRSRKKMPKSPMCQ